MENSNEKVTPRRRAVIMGLLFIILVVLPGISWLYLRNGLNWHKKAVAELRYYGQIRPAYFILPTGEKFNDLENKVCVVASLGVNPDLTEGNKRILDVGERLFNQFGKMSDETIRPDFRIVIVCEGGTAEFTSYYQKLPSYDYATWTKTGGVGAWETILKNQYEKFCLDEGIKTPATSYFALTDPAGNIRRFYDVMDDAQVNRMVEHIALLLPKQ